MHLSEIDRRSVHQQSRATSIDFKTENRNEGTIQRHRMSGDYMSTCRDQCDRSLEVDDLGGIPQCMV